MMEGSLSYHLDRGYFAYEGEEWWLYSLGEAPEDSEADKSIDPIRQLDLQEVADVGRLAEVSRVVDSDCAFEKFYRETDRLSDAMEAALQNADTQAVFNAGDEINRQFGIWLGAFRACDDHTSHQLSESFGDESSVFRHFKDLTSEEYDANFAYRLCWGLRNASQHAGNVLNDMRVDFTRADEYAEARMVLVAELDAQRTAERFPKISAKVREELRACSGALQVVTLARALRDSVHRLRSGLLVRIATDHEDLIQQCWSLQEEAWAVKGGRWAVFLDQPPERMAEERFRIRYNHYQQAELLIRYFDRSKKMADSPPLSVEAHDLVLAPGEPPPDLPI